MFKHQWKERAVVCLSELVCAYVDFFYSLCFLFLFDIYVFEVQTHFLGLVCFVTSFTYLNIFAVVCMVQNPVGCEILVFIYGSKMPFKHQSNKSVIQHFNMIYPLKCHPV